MSAIQADPHTVFEPASSPTMYFIGVTTGKSSIMNVFPKWIQHLGIPQARIQGIDCKLHDSPQTYRRIVEFIKRDPLSRGALVTTHKLDLFSAAGNLFDDLGPNAKMLGEVSGIAKRSEKLVGFAADPQTSGLALEAILGNEYWQKTGGEMLILGAGGAATALAVYLMQPQHGANRPAKITIIDKNPARLSELESLCCEVESQATISFQRISTETDSDRALAALRPYSMVVNATGLGKDAPGSPITADAIFPEHGIAWDFNYRGELIFLDQARAQAKSRKLRIEDGWIYFLHGWQRVIAEVFETPIPTSGPVFDELSALASAARK